MYLLLSFAPLDFTELPDGWDKIHIGAGAA